MRLFTPILLLFIAFSSYSQNITIKIDQSTGLIEGIVILQNEVMIEIKEDGKLISACPLVQNGQFALYAKGMEKNYRFGTHNFVGKIPVTYYDKDNFTNHKNTYGRLKSLGDITFEYYDRNSFSNDKYTVGRIKKINDIELQYYDRDSFSTDKYTVNKIKKIGNIEIQYDTHWQSKQPGLLKELLGTDERFSIWQ